MKRNTPPIRAGRLAAAALVFLMAGCASFSGIEVTSQKLSAQDLGARSGRTDWPQQAWWHGYDDPQLNGLIAHALNGNPNLRLAEARRRKARALAEISESTLWPHLTGDVDSTRQRFSEHGEVPPPLAGTIENVNHARLNVGWELDFFGRNWAALDAALGRARAAEADAQAARVLLASDVTRTYYRLAALIEKRRLLSDTLAQRQDILKLVESRVKAGIDTKVELRQAEASLPEIRREIEAFAEQIDLARHALAVLAGAGPEATSGLSPALPTTQLQTLPASLPADLIGRRADLTAARWRVESALRDIDVAKADFYPNVNLIAFAGFSSIGLDSWFKGGSREFGVGGALHLPIFEAGRLRAGLRGTTADADAAVESYNATLIQAVREVADQITSLQSIEKQAREQHLAQTTAESALDLARQRYQAGLGSYITVLVAETNVLAQRRVTTDLKARAIDANLQLIRTLGGGYSAT